MLCYNLRLLTCSHVIRAACNALTSADEHAQTSVSNMATALPLPAGAQTAEKQHAGLLKLEAQSKLG